MNNEKIVLIEDVLYKKINYARITTTTDTFIVPLHIGLHLSKWLLSMHKYRSHAKILRFAYKWKMSEKVNEKCKNYN